MKLQDMTNIWPWH